MIMPKIIKKLILNVQHMVLHTLLKHTCGIIVCMEEAIHYLALPKKHANLHGGGEMDVMLLTQHQQYLFSFYYMKIEV